jgi:hypothetical protein
MTLHRPSCLAALLVLLAQANSRAEDMTRPLIVGHRGLLNHTDFTDSLC